VPCITFDKPCISYYHRFARGDVAFPYLPPQGKVGILIHLHCLEIGLYPRIRNLFSNVLFYDIADRFPAVVGLILSPYKGFRALYKVSYAEALFHYLKGFRVFQTRDLFIIIKQSV